MKGIQESEIKFAEQQAVIKFANKSTVKLSDIVEALKKGGYRASAV